MPTLSTLLKTRIPVVRNRWVIGIVYVVFLAVALYCFSDLCATLAKADFGQSRFPPIVCWLATCLVLALAVFFFYAIIDEWRHGPRRMRKQRDEHDA
jgi:uncharacterized membrane protein